MRRQWWWISGWRFDRIKGFLQVQWLLPVLPWSGGRERAWSHPPAACRAAGAPRPQTRSGPGSWSRRSACRGNRWHARLSASGTGSAAVLKQSFQMDVSACTADWNLCHPLVTSKSQHYCLHFKPREIRKETRGVSYPERTWMKIRAGAEVQINQFWAIHIQGLSHVKAVMSTQLYYVQEPEQWCVNNSMCLSTLTSIAEQPHRLSFFRELCFMISFW